MGQEKMIGERSEIWKEPVRPMNWPNATSVNSLSTSRDAPVIPAFERRIIHAGKGPGVSDFAIAMVGIDHAGSEVRRVMRIALGRDFATVISTTGASSTRSVEDVNLTVVTELNQLASKLPHSLATEVRKSLDRLWEALADDSVLLNAPSGRAAISLLLTATDVRSPQISVTDDGLFYLQWTDGPRKLLGAIIHSDGSIVWSATRPNQNNLNQQLPASAVSNQDEFLRLFSTVAPWALDDEARRRAA
jgi:hypothetical protein